LFRSNAKISDSTSLWLDFFRGLASLEVLFGHLFVMVFGQLPRPPGLTGFVTGAMGVISSRSHYAVIVFFALSGFLVGGPFLVKASEGLANPRSYAIARMSRLYTVVIPALALTLLLAHPGIQQFAAARPSFFPDVTQYGAETATCNALFLQTLYCQPLGVNGSLWSLSNEAFYYAFWLCLVMGGRWWFGALGWALLYGLSPMANIGYVICFGIWAAGALVFAFERHKIAIAVLLGIAFAAWSFSPEAGLGAVFLALLLALDRFNVPFKLPAKPFRALANLSFSLYAVHLPVIVFALISLGVVNPIARNWYGILIFWTVAVGTFGFSALFWWCFERQTNRIRKALNAYCERFLVLRFQSKA
jgi:peptidoglycan/LPS O-acetylase OafA/YrhL